MEQYSRIKEKYPDTVLLFRMGDFFETFDDDAHITAKVCGIVLTKRNNGAAGESPLAGFPHHQLDNYLPKLVKAGYRVAVCEQLEDPKKAKGIVKRGVIEVVTPGVALYDKLLDSGSNNFIATVYLDLKKNQIEQAAIASADISTGEFNIAVLRINEICQYLESINPAELVIAKSQKEFIDGLLDDLTFKAAITKLEDWIFDFEFTNNAILKHFGTQSLKGFGIEGSNSAVSAAGTLLHYISETRQDGLTQIQNIRYINTSEIMLLDAEARRNLELDLATYNKNENNTLFAILDKTITPMGGRLIKKWISNPLINLEPIKRRLESVRYFYSNPSLINELILALNNIGDIERIISKICSGRANPRDIVALKQSIFTIPIVKSCFEAHLSLLTSEYTLPELIYKCVNDLNPLNRLVEMIDSAFVDEPAASLGSGNSFRKGYNKELDEYIEAKYSAKNWLDDYREKQRIESGISTLKVGFNNVFGYYIEISNANKNKVPEHYERRQTLTNGERYITPELKEFETKILSAEDKINQIESEIFTSLTSEIISFTAEIQQNAELIGIIDCLQSFAQSALENNYIEPQINHGDIINIKGGRHPVVEKMLRKGDYFTPNDTYLSAIDSQIHIITGPNMAGKSCYIRQVGSIVLMSQIGSFVPAESAEIGITDRIFVRAGARDNLTGGESTFLIEMQEAANILNNATSKSLVLFDELGRGTATFDGISIAWAVCEYLHDSIKAKTLFATHYHELSKLAEHFDGIKNYKADVVRAGTTVIFSHNICEGNSDSSYGIYVAKIGGIPKFVVDRADEIMATLINDFQDDEKAIRRADVDSITKSSNQTEQLAIFEFRDDELREQLIGLDLNAVTPIQALQILADMQKKARKGKR